MRAAAWNAVGHASQADARNVESGMAELYELHDTNVERDVRLRALEVKMDWLKNAWCSLDIEFGPTGDTLAVSAWVGDILVQF